MANTYTSLHYHLVFSTKNRTPWIHPDIEQRIWKYMGGICHQHDMVPLKIGGMPDHVHMLVGLRPTWSVSKALQTIKGPSTMWIHEQFPTLRNFAWQDGYAAFTVSRSNLASVSNYIETQREHHEERTFQEELIELLEKHEIDYDPRYLWT